MRNILILLMLVCSGVYAQDTQNIDADTAKVAKSGYNRISIKTGKLFFRGLTGTKKEVVSTNNSYANPAWIPSLALSKITGLQDSLSNSVKKISGKGLSANDYTTTEKTKLAGVATGATANSADATLLSRTNHTGTQTSSTISDFNTAADARVVAGITGKANLAGGNTFTGTQTIGEIANTQITGTTQYFTNSVFSNVLNYSTQGLNFKNNAGIIIHKFFDNGNIGIGTFTDTGEKLQVNGTSKFTGAVNVIGANITFENNTGIVGKKTNGIGRNILATGGDNTVYFSSLGVGFNFWNDGITQKLLSILENGNVGIGTGAPTSKLQVVGLPVYENNTLALAGGLTAGAFYRTSIGVLMVAF